MIWLSLITLRAMSAFPPFGGSCRRLLRWQPIQQLRRLLGDHIPELIRDRGDVGEAGERLAHVEGRRRDGGGFRPGYAAYTGHRLNLVPPIAESTCYR